MCVYGRVDGEGTHETVRLRAKLDEDCPSMLISMSGARAVGQHPALGTTFKCHWYEEGKTLSRSDDIAITDSLWDCDLLLGKKQIEGINLGRREIIGILGSETTEQRRLREQQDRKHHAQNQAVFQAENVASLIGHDLWDNDLQRTYQYVRTNGLSFQVLSCCRVEGLHLSGGGIEQLWLGLCNQQQRWYRVLQNGEYETDSCYSDRALKNGRSD